MFPDWESWKTLVSVRRITPSLEKWEASNTPTIRRLTPSCRHQLSRIAPQSDGLNFALFRTAWPEIFYPIGLSIRSYRLRSNCETLSFEDAKKLAFAPNSGHPGNICREGACIN
jgi:hypothetical protein